MGIGPSFQLRSECRPNGSDVVASGFNVCPHSCSQAGSFVPYASRHVHIQNLRAGQDNALCEGRLEHGLANDLNGVEVSFFVSEIKFQELLLPFFPDVEIWVDRDLYAAEFQSEAHVCKYIVLDGREILRVMPDCATVAFQPCCDLWLG